MKLVIAPGAARDLASQFGYLVDQGAGDAADRLEKRLTTYLSTTLAAHPRTGTQLHHRGLWETWVPKTRLVVWYRFTADELQIVRVWHTSQDRRA